MLNKKTVLELLILTKPISKSSVIPAIGHHFTIRDSILLYHSENVLRCKTE